MTPTLVAQMVQSSIRPIQDSLRRKDHDYSQEEVRELFDACAVASILVETLWKKSGQLLDQGIESGKLSSLLKEYMTSVQESLAVFTLVQEIATNHTPTYEGMKGTLSKLHQDQQRAEEVKKEFESLLDWLRTSQRQISPASISSKAGSTSEAYENLNDILARLQAGGEL